MAVSILPSPITSTWSGRPDVTRFRSRGHNTFIRSNGSFEIRTLEEDVEFAKLGADGQGVEL
jgi:hypothetical protein